MILNKYVGYHTAACLVASPDSMPQNHVNKERHHLMPWGQQHEGNITKETARGTGVA